MTYYVQRDQSGAIIALFANAQDFATEYLPEDNAEIVAFNAALATRNVTEGRQGAYQKRSDPLFFKWQRGEATEQEWKDEVSAIQAEFPKAS